MNESWKLPLMSRLQWAVARTFYGMVNYRHPLRRKSLEAVLSSYHRVASATTPLECCEIFQAIRAVEKIEGDIAEAGVFRGGTAQLMLSSSSKHLHLFDTFEGLPHSENQYEVGKFSGSVADVRKNLHEHTDRIEFHPGLFPASAVGFEHLRFSFVHLDLDLYDSTLGALAWFWPRISVGGILLSHDFPLSAGVVRAFHEFFDSRPEPFVPLSGNQCLAVKLSL